MHPKKNRAGGALGQDRTLTLTLALMLTLMLTQTLMLTLTAVKQHHNNVKILTIIAQSPQGNHFFQFIFVKHAMQE